jgi:hypothetical protein
VCVCAGWCVLCVCSARLLWASCGGVACGEELGWLLLPRQRWGKSTAHKPGLSVLGFLTALFFFAREAMDFVVTAGCVII